MSLEWLRHTERLDQAALQESVRLLAQGEPVFGCIVERLGYPPLWERAPGFPTLVHIILEQQVSLASARAAFERLNDACLGVTPQSFLALDDAHLKRIGFSRQKTAYCRGLASEIVAGSLDLECLVQMDDQSARAYLVRLKGIGPWTAEIYLLMALLRPDAWPIHDRALAIAVQRAFGLAQPPSPDELERIGAAWRPQDRKSVV